jgi:glycosyltransferase involved in cell wall biosynthesis
MKCLFLTNFYPPAIRGGYELWCQEVAEGLENRGHEVVVLTSRHGRNRIKQPEPAWIRRELYLEMELASLRNGVQFFTSRKARENENLIRFRQLAERFQPDIIMIWGMWNLPRSLPALAEEILPDRVVYYIGDYWPTLPSQFEYYWQSPARHWLTAMPKNILGKFALRALNREIHPPLRFSHVLFPSAFMREEFRRRGIEPQKAKIIYGAVDTSLYTSANGSSRIRQGGTISLLYAGRLTQDKGVHTAIQALSRLVHRFGQDQIKLTIVGTGENKYVSYLNRLALQDNVAQFVTFLGAQPKEAMPEIYRRADVLLFTSIWPEPFGRVLIEAMASGLIIVGTATGGAKEVLVNNENALVFPPGDSRGLAYQIIRLTHDSRLRDYLVDNSKRIAVEKFHIRRMILEIENYIQEVII